MTGRIKTAVIMMLVAMIFVFVFAYHSSHNLYKNPAAKGTFVFETLEEQESWMFI